MMIDVLLIGLVIYRPSIGMAVWVAVLIVFRHVPLLAEEIARMLRLDSYHGLTAHVAHVALPAWSPMSSGEEPRVENGAQAVHVSVPGTAGSRDTNAVAPNDETTIRDRYLLDMADQKDERGAYLFSANQIHAAIGGHRATVLAKVRDRRSATLPPVYRADDGAAIPATHPITRDPHGPAA